MDGGAGVSRGGREGARGVRGERDARVAGGRDARRGGAELRAAAEPNEGAERIECDAICRGMPRDSRAISAANRAAAANPTLVRHLLRGRHAGFHGFPG